MEEISKPMINYTSTNVINVGDRVKVCGDDKTYVILKGGIGKTTAVTPTGNRKERRAYFTKQRKKKSSFC